MKTTQASPTKKIAAAKSNTLKAKSNHKSVQSQSHATFTIVAIGASAGGLEAISLLLKNLAPDTGMAFIYVQHLSPNHKSMLPTLLSKTTEMQVQDIDNMEKMEPNNVYIIPFDKEIEVVDGHIRLTPRTNNKSTNLSIDILFSSLAETHKENVIGIILSGNGSDGTQGIKEIKQAGGITFAQDDTAKFDSMPKSAIEEGVVDFVLPPQKIAEEINWMSKNPIIKSNTSENLGSNNSMAEEDELANNDPDLKVILNLLQKTKNVDFSQYKMNTIKRRILRRMLVLKINSIKQYASLMRKKQVEIELLFNDLLINVTDFFRDEDAFLYLKREVLPALLKTKKPNETFRIWVAACATGEEAYSIAMTLLELQAKKTNPVPFQIFASDLSAEAILEARTGEYTIHQLKNVSPKRLQQFFTKVKDKYRISRALRDVCIFAQHNILFDPPFSRMDFISCRNLLIYLDTTAQKKVITTLHYSLNEGGCLMLGRAETTGTSEMLFNVLEKKLKFYTRKRNSAAIQIPEISSRLQTTSTLHNAKKLKDEIKNAQPPPPLKLSIGNTFDAILLSRYVPASVMINYAMDILEFRGPTELYLKHTSGKASFNILKMAYKEMIFELRNAIHHAIKSKQIVQKFGVELKENNLNSSIRLVNLEVIPHSIVNEEPFLLVIFTDQQRPELIDENNLENKKNTPAKDRRIKKLEEELTSARTDMSSITHDQEVANEELQSANEELVSSNEELQSLNEELETSKEEIESTNEELITSNQEMYARINQIEELYTYYEAVLATFQEPMLILDKDIRIKSANKSFCKTFHTKEEDCIGVSLFKLGNNQWNIPKLRNLLEDVVPKNSRIFEYEVESTFPIIGKKTMLLNAHRVHQKTKNEEIIVLTIVDITQVRKLAIELELKEKKVLKIKLDVEKKEKELLIKTSERFRHLLTGLPAGVYSCDEEGLISFYNDSAAKLWGRKPIIGKEYWCGAFKILNIDGNVIPLDESPMAIAFKEGRSITGKELIIEREDGTRSNVLVHPQPEFDLAGKVIGAINMVFDITEQMVIKNELINAKSIAEQKTLIAEDAVKAKQQFLSNMSHEIRTPMNAIIGFTNVLLKTELNNAQLEYINAIKTSGDALIFLINDILDIAKVDAGKMTFENTRFNLSESVALMLQLFDTKIQEKNIAFEKVFDKSIPQFVVGDPMRLRQIVLNLLSNAVKFTSSGKIMVNVNILNNTAEKIKIEFVVTDTGIGIKENRLENIFEDFEQATYENSRLYGGTGLGLSIVKKLVELQGGSISVKSKLGKGSTFSFILEFAIAKEIIVEANTKTIEASNYTNLTGKKINVLVAEDMALNQLLIKIILADFGFNIDIADNGKIAIEKVKTNTYDIILMDLQMPEINGFEATKYIRNELQNETPIIALTADVTTVDVDKCKASGMNDYISKPIDEKILYNKILSLVNHS